MLSPISPILDYVREKTGKSRLDYKYNRELKGAREKERRRRLPLPTVAGVQMPAARYNVGIQRAIPDVPRLSTVLIVGKDILS